MGLARDITASRLYRPVLVGLTIVILAITVGFWIYGFLGPPGWRVGNDDLAVYTDATRRLLGGGSFYLDRQLHGAYEITPGDVLYPPVTAWFFALWLVLPGWSFVVIPVALTARGVGRMRPAMWTWPLIALCLAWPLLGLKVIRSNPSTWISAAAAMGLLYGWPGALILLKPSFVPFAVIGIRRRTWWLVAGLIVVASLPFLADTLTYPRVVLDGRGGGVLYSLPDLPFVVLPLVAWLGRTRRLDRTTGGTGAGPPPGRARG
jgi:hypothetical protein